MTIGDSIVNNGLYSWPVENGPSMNCLVRIGSGTGAVSRHERSSVHHRFASFIDRFFFCSARELDR